MYISILWNCYTFTLTLEALLARRIVFEKDPCNRFITCLLGLSLSRLGLPGFTFPEWNLSENIHEKSTLPEV